MGGSTTNLRDHLRTWHPGKVDAKITASASRPEVRLKDIGDEKDRERCKRLQRSILEAVKTHLPDLPVIRGNTEAARRVDAVVSELDVPPLNRPRLMSRNDIRIHLLHVMSEQRRYKKRKEHKAHALSQGQSIADDREEEQSERETAAPCNVSPYALDRESVLGDEERESSEVLRPMAPPTVEEFIRSVTGKGNGKRRSHQEAQKSQEQMEALLIAVTSDSSLSNNDTTGGLSSTARRTRLAPFPSLSRSSAGQIDPMMVSIGSLLSIADVNSGDGDSEHSANCDFTDYELNGWEGLPITSRFSLGAGDLDGSRREGESQEGQANGRSLQLAPEDNLLVNELVSLGQL